MQGRLDGEFFICVNFFVWRDGWTENFLFVSTFLYAGTDGRRIFYLCQLFCMQGQTARELFLFVSTFLYAGTDGHSFFLFVSTFL